MAQTYAELLKSQGATEDELKVLVTPASEKAYAALLKQADEAAQRAFKAEELVKANKKWYDEVAEPTAAKALAERDQALADAAAERARVKKLSDLGLIKIAEQMEGGGGEHVTPPTPTGTTVTPPDMSKFVTADQLKTITAAAGKGIARMANIAREHAKLGLPDVDFDALYDEATASGKQLPEYWAEKFNVNEKRAAAAQAEKEAYEKRLKEEGAAAVRAEYQKSNPHLIRPETSNSPFALKPPSAVDPAAQPWNISDAEKANRRMQKGLDGLSKHGLM